MIHTENLSKKFVSYKKEPGFLGSMKSFVHREEIIKDAVKNFSCHIDQGKIVGLLGPNGAGKTTLMKMLTGIIVPSSGKVKVGDFVPWERSSEFKKNIALVMGQKSQLWWDIPALDSFLLLQKYYEIDESSFRKRLKELSALLEVEDLLKIHLRRLSLGERMKMELMASLFHSPKVIFLDEPTIGLDLVAQDNIRKFLLDFHEKENMTIVLTSHYMADIEALCSELILVQNGEKKFDGKIQEFSRILGPKKLLSFSFADVIDDRSFFETYEVQWRDEGKTAEFAIDSDQVNEITIHLLKNYAVEKFSSGEIPIERVMKALMKKDGI